MKENEFITKLLRPWLKKHDWASGYIEAKVSKGKSLPFSSFQYHQLATLRKVSLSQDVYKIPDSATGIKPSDIIVLNKANGWVAILFEKDKRPIGSFYLIDIKNVYHIKDRLKKRSLTKKDCEYYGVECSI